jgi:tetratricopeptide (TPR) repeat protein
MIVLRLFAPRLILAAAVLGLAVSVVSFSNVSIGSVIDNVEMLTLEGSSQALLGNEQANVFLFFRPDQGHSKDVLKDVALLEEELREKSVSWVAIVSDRYSREEVQAVVEQAGLEIPVLLDQDDALSGKLGVHLHPVVGVTDHDQVLKAYQHFKKVNFIHDLRAQILHLLGELSDAELAETLNPAPVVRGKDNSAAKSNIKLAKMLLKAGNLPKALERARKALEYDPAQPEAHALVGAILAEQDDCPGALAAFDQALNLDPNEPVALEGKKACLGGV